MNTRKLFSGFSDRQAQLTPIPEEFFQQVLAQVEDINELKLILHAFWLANRQDGSKRYFRRTLLEKDNRLLEMLTVVREDPKEALEQALCKAVESGVFLQAVVRMERGEEVLYFFNNPYGQAAVRAIERGEWRMSGDEDYPLQLEVEFPNIYRMYEQHIAPLTPMMADTLRDAEEMYDIQWIEEAIRIAVEQNKRNWRYIEAILKRWKEEGKGERKSGQDTEEALRRYADQWKRKQPPTKR